MDIEEQRPGRIACIGRVNAAAGKAPQKKTIHSAERELPIKCASPNTLDIVKNPGDLRR